MEKFRKDARYKKYVQLVEKILQSFDKEVNEWVDFISFLGKLLKVINYKFVFLIKVPFHPNIRTRVIFVTQAFQAYPQFQVIPRKLIVAKRLAQSLNPALPPGVHQKALEVYEYIFDRIGVRILSLLHFQSIIYLK